MLALRRPLTLLLLAPFMGLKRRDNLFFGWLGPAGGAAIYYALHVQETLHDPRSGTITSAAVTASVLLHGMTASPGCSSTHDWRRKRPGAGSQSRRCRVGMPAQAGSPAFRVCLSSHAAHHRLKKQLRHREAVLP